METKTSRSLQDIVIIALTTWREARDGSRKERIMIQNVIENRIRDKRWPDDAFDVCLQPKEFDCHAKRTPQRWPTRDNPEEWAVWQDCLALAATTPFDYTNKANHYVLLGAKREWTDAKKITAVEGNFVFYKL